MAEASLRIVPTDADQYDRVDAARHAFRKAHFQLLRSPVVLDAALRRPGIADLETVREQKNPSEWLIETIDAASVDDPTIFVIRLRGKRPEDLRRILLAVTEAYLDDILTEMHESMTARHRWLEEESAVASTELLEKTAAHEKAAERRPQSEEEWDHVDTLRDELTKVQRRADSLNRELRRVPLDRAAEPRAALVGEVTVKTAN